MSITRLASVMGMLAVSLLTACEGGEHPTGIVDQPGGIGIPGADARPIVLGDVTCAANVASGTVSCAPARAAPATGDAGALSSVVIGGQGLHVELESSNVAYAEEEEAFTFDVTVRNLIGQAIGTVDGESADAEGVRVFFHTEPVVTQGEGAITVDADGRDIFTTTQRPYYRYDELLAPGAASDPREWRFHAPATVEAFTFRVLVSAPVQHPGGWLELSADSLRLRTGDELVVTATPYTVFGEVDDSAVVVWQSSDEAIATVDAEGRIAVAGSGTTTITATTGERSGSFSLTACLDLAVGESYTATGPAARAICIAGVEGATAEFTYVPLNTSETSALEVGVTATGTVSAMGPPTPAPRTGDAFRVAPAPAREWRPGADRIVANETNDASRAPGAMPMRIVPGTPTVGDLWELNVAPGCTGTRDDRVGQVAHIGEHVILVVDTANPYGGFSAAQLDSIAAEMDSIAYPVVTENFGEPTDLDGNDRIVAFITRAVNELTPPGAEPLSQGHFDSRDLYSSAPGSCPRSNEGEILYLGTPDPTGEVNGNVRTLSYVRSVIVRTFGAELASLVNASRRIYVHGAPELEEPWLDAALGAVAMELMFYRVSAGLEPGQNIDLAMLTSGPNASRRVAAFNMYQNQNFGQLRPWLQRPDTTGVFRMDTTQAAQGAAWAFLRYAADRTGGAQADFWHALVNTSLTGKANIAAVIGADPDEWLRDFVVAMYADDAVPGAPAEHTQPSWNVRSVYSGLGGFPLLPVALKDGETATRTFAPGGAAYMRFGVPREAFADVLAQAGGGGPLPGTFGVTVMRTK